MNSISPPTDHFYKFLAVSGLLLIITTVSLLSILSDIGLEKSLEFIRQYEETYKGNTSPDSTEKEFVRNFNVFASNLIWKRDFLIVMCVFGGFLSFFGIRKWMSELQPLRDEIAMLERDKLQKELALLDRQLDGGTKKPS